MQKIIIAVAIIFISSFQARSAAPFFTPVSITATCLTANAVLFYALSVASAVAANSTTSVSLGPEYYFGAQLSLATAVISTAAAIPFWTISIVQHTRNHAAFQVSPNSARLVLDF